MQHRHWCETVPAANSLQLKCSIQSIRREEAMLVIDRKLRHPRVCCGAVSAQKPEQILWELGQCSWLKIVPKFSLITIMLMIWGWEYDGRDPKGSHTFKVDASSWEHYLTMLSTAHDTSWSYFLTKDIATDNWGTQQSSVHSSSNKQTSLTAALSAHFLFLIETPEDHFWPIRMCLWRCSRQVNNAG